MRTRSHALLPLALGAALLLPAARTARAAPSLAERAAAKAAADLEAVIEGLKLAGIDPDRRQLLAEYAGGDYCYCGCPHTLGSCALQHKACKHSARQLRLAAGVLVARPTATVAELARLVGAYYASFDRRARIDVAGFGPPLGDEKAPVTLVVYSDFLCPFCQSYRPVLEAFVAAHPDEVKLYFKPFPLDSHPGAVDVAMAAEWGRDRGAFWPLHDALFEAQAHDLDAMAAVAERLGLDAEDLRDAVTARKHEQKVLASRASGTKAGVRSTPTVFMNGRRLELPDNTAEWLQFTLEDEKEWSRHPGKWDRD